MAEALHPGVTQPEVLVIDDDLEALYRDADGRVRVLYLDRGYNDTHNDTHNDTQGLLHEDAHEDAERVEFPGNDGNVIEVRVLAPLDLAVSKLARFRSQDREDIELLALEKVVDAKSLGKRAEEALGGYVGDLASIRTSIDLACNVVEAAQPRP